MNASQATTDTGSGVRGGMEPEVEQPARAYSSTAQAAGQYKTAFATALIVLSLIAWLPSGAARAGISSENVAVVVNGKSLNSRTIANHYIGFRNIPTRNVVVLDDVPDGIKTDLKSFRDKILNPLLSELDSRGIAPAIRVIAYSTDFPTAIGISEHTKKIEDETAKKYLTPVGSLTGLTYFYRYILADSHGYLGFGSNFYARARFIRNFINPFKGEQKDQFDQAVEDFEQEKFVEAAEAWTELLKNNPTMPGIAIKAAEAYSLAEDDEKAKALVLAAVKAGWWSRTYLEDTPSLQRLLDDERIKKLLPVLDDGPISWQGPIGFNSVAGWTVAGDRIPANKGGVPYLCSCSLAVTGPNASMPGEAVRILRRASKADRTFPKGRFSFSSTGDVRSKTRVPGLTDAIVYLQEMGFDTEISKSAVPDKPGAINGMMVGTPSANLQAPPWTMVRGAIAENLTSYGGAFGKAGQTKLTEFLAAGAAMSSGTVAEPYSLQFKFPTPMLYPYYARGLTAIESFYQSVACPYQLLIVGDPLTQPFAKAPDEYVDISFIKEDKPRLRMARRSLGLKIPKTPTATIEITVNDRPFRTTPAVPTVDINWPDSLIGVHDIRVTLTGLDRTQPRVSFAQEIDIAGDKQTPVATITKGRKKIEGFANNGSEATPIELKLTCEGADRIELVFLGKPIGEVQGDEGVLSVPTNELGGGPLRFRPVAFFGEAAVRGHTVVDPFPESSESDK